MVHVLAIVAVVGGPFLRAMGRVVGPIQVEQDALRHAVAATLLQIGLRQGERQAVAGAAGDRVLQAGERRLAGQVGVAGGQAPADQLEQGIAPQGVGVVLVGVAAGDLEDALAHEGLQRVLPAAAAPLGEAGGEGRAQAERRLRLGQPGQAAVAGEPPAVERGHQGHRGRGSEGVARCGRISNHGSLLGVVGRHTTRP